MWRVLTITSKIINKNSPIGFFDSGVGGLTVFSEFRKELPNEDCIYFGDTQNMPYGEKTKEQLIEYSKKAFEFFEAHQVKAVVMACNTTSATVYDLLKDEYSFKLYPVIQSVTKVFAELPVKKIGVFATPATINSHAYASGIKKFAPNKEICEIACPDWVRIVENHEEETPEAIEKIKLKMGEMMKFHPDRIILGCTHYPFLIKQLASIENENMFINPAKYYVNYIKNDMMQSDMLTDSHLKGSERFYCSSNPEKFKKAAEMFHDMDGTEVLLFP